MLSTENAVQLCDLIPAVSEKWDAEIFLYSHAINHGNVDDFILKVKQIENSKPNFVLILTTDGGDPDAAFKAARFLKRTYQDGKIFAFIFGMCKSAGTLLALVANNIIISDFGELGPLDIQVLKTEDLNRESGLTIKQSLRSIGQQSVEMFGQCVNGILPFNQGADGQYLISLKTAESIASQITTGLLSQMTQQIDPLRLGETDRLVKIAKKYGEILREDLPQNALQYLIEGYPSHTFVIDLEEVQRIFGRGFAFPPSSLEESLQNLL